MRSRKISGGENATSGITYQNQNQNQYQPANTYSKVYDGAASYGKFIAILSLIFSCLFTIVLVSIGVYLLITPDVHSESVQGKIVTPNCNFSMGSTKQLTCGPTVTFTIKGKEYTKTYGQTNVTSSYSQGQSITILYDPKNPDDSIIKSAVSRTGWGWILIGIGSVVFLIGIVGYYLTMRYKFLAAAQGVSSVF